MSISTSTPATERRIDPATKLANSFLPQVPYAPYADYLGRNRSPLTRPNGGGIEEPKTGCIQAPTDTLRPQALLWQHWTDSIAQRSSRIPVSSSSFVKPPPTWNEKLRGSVLERAESERCRQFHARHAGRPSRVSTIRSAKTMRFRHHPYYRRVLADGEDVIGHCDRHAQRQGRWASCLVITQPNVSPDLFFSPALSNTSATSFCSFSHAMSCAVAPRSSV